MKKKTVRYTFTNKYPKEDVGYFSIFAIVFFGCAGLFMIWQISGHLPNYKITKTECHNETNWLEEYPLPLNLFCYMSDISNCYSKMYEAEREGKIKIISGDKQYEELSKEGVRLNFSPALLDSVVIANGTKEVCNPVEVEEIEYKKSCLDLNSEERSKLSYICIKLDTIIPSKMCGDYGAVICMGKITMNISKSEITKEFLETNANCIEYNCLGKECKKGDCHIYKIGDYEVIKQ